MKTIGQRLKEARKARGMSQTALAEKIGASRGVITNIELNIVEDPQPIVINAICDVLQINKEWLLENKGPMDSRNEASRSAKVLSEIYTYAQGLSEKEQLFILDLIRSYTKHRGD